MEVIFSLFWSRDVAQRPEKCPARRDFVANCGRLVFQHDGIHSDHAPHFSSFLTPSHHALQGQKPNTHTPRRASTSSLPITDTPLHWSAYRGNLGITWILLKVRDGVLCVCFSTVHGVDKKLSVLKTSTSSLTNCKKRSYSSGPPL